MEKKFFSYILKLKNYRHISGHAPIGEYIDIHLKFKNSDVYIKLKIEEYYFKEKNILEGGALKEESA